MKNRVLDISKGYKSTQFIYNISPDKNSSFRKGTGKAGNLNSALQIVKKDEEINYVETRDCDDIVPDKNFLKSIIFKFLLNERLAFIQTIKKPSDEDTDLFGNEEQLFYEVLMKAKNGSNSVFPCGSGVVWKKKALLDIGGFPHWNLVEDFQSGIEALKKKWEGMYLNIVGAKSQISPRDLSNVYKQRGTWSIDSLRYLIWGDFTGLSFRQRLQFIEPSLFYMLSALSFVFVFFISFASIFDYKFIHIENNIDFLLVYLGYIFLLINYQFTLASYGKVSLRNIIISLQIFYGLGPLYLVSMFKAFFFGPYRKPQTHITRKQHEHQLYLRLIWPHLLIMGLAIFVYVDELADFISSKSIQNLDLVVLGWLTFFLFMYSRVVGLAFYKSEVVQTFRNKSIQLKSWMF